MTFGSHMHMSPPSQWIECFHPPKKEHFVTPWKLPQSIQPLTAPCMPLQIIDCRFISWAYF